MCLIKFVLLLLLKPKKMISNHPPITKATREHALCHLKELQVQVIFILNHEGVSSI